MSSRDPHEGDEPDARRDGRDGRDERAEYEAIEAELRALGDLLGDLLDPPAPAPADVAAAVRARLAAPTPDAGSQADAPGGSGRGGPGETPEPAERRHVPERRRRRRPARWKVAVAVVAAVAALVAATPQGRAAVERVLRYAGIELRMQDTTPPPVTTTAPLPGEHTVAPPDVPRLARTPAALGPPQRTTVSDGGRVVSMFWPGGIRLDQFDGTMDPIIFKKLGPPYPDYAEVGGRTAWWIKGEHPLGYIKRADGTEVPLRQAGPTLIWQHGILTLRLEGLESKEEAIRIAESLG